VTVSVTGVTSVTGDEFIPKTPEAYTYDDDGDVLSDGRWDYTWDRENRLIVVSSATTIGDQRYLEFEYDYTGRRIGKKDTGRWLNRDPIGERGGINLLPLSGMLV